VQQNQATKVKKCKRKRVRKVTRRDTTNWVKKGTGTGRTVAVAFRLGEASYKSVALLAEENGELVSELIREWIMKMLIDDPQELITTAQLERWQAEHDTEIKALKELHKVQQRGYMNQIEQMAKMQAQLEQEVRNLKARLVR